VSLRIGLTGGIGSGKSTVAAWLVAQGALIVDTDAIARGLTAPGGSALPAIAEQFGAEMIDPQGALDRAKMRSLVFAAPSAKHELEHILHPLIGAHAEAQAETASTGQVVVFDVPLLAESSHWRRRVAKVLVIDCLHSTQVGRVRARSGWSNEEVLRVIAQQSRRDRRRAIADAVVYNEALDQPGLAAQLSLLWHSGFFHSNAPSPL
jgi:dephospho-CoA kinase